MTVIYLSNSTMQLVGGEGGSQAVVHSCVSDKRIGACLFNGSVTDPEGFCRIVEENFSKYAFSRRNVTLVLNTTQVIARTIRLPAQNEEKTLAYIANEFSDVERAKNPVNAYSVLHTDPQTGFSRVLAMQADETYIRTVVSLFARCGIQVKQVQYYITGAIRALAETKAADSACIVQVMEQTGFTGILFVDGAYIYSTVARVSGEHGTPELGSELARSVSVTVQASKAQQLTQSVTDVYFAGFSEADALCAGEAIGRMGGMLHTETLGESKRIKIKCQDLGLRDCLYAAGGLLTDNPANFLRHMSESRQKKKTGSVVKAAIALLVLASVLTAATLWLGALRGIRQAQLRAITAQNTSDEVTKQRAYSDALKQSNADLRERLEALTRLSETVQAYPLPNTSVTDELLVCARGYADAQVLSYSADTGELVFTATAAAVDNIHKFIRRISEHEMFEVLDYSGYRYNDTAGVWSVNVTVRLAADAGRGR